MLVHATAIVLIVLMVFGGTFFVPLTGLYYSSTEYPILVGKLFLTLLSMILYLVLHELVHGICMKWFGKTKVHYGFTGLYAYAGSSSYFNKSSYVVISLAPVVLWGIVLSIITCMAAPSWFWFVYLVQVCNISGAAGDFYVVYRMAKMPADILVQDSGTAMTIYAPSPQ